MSNDSLPVIDEGMPSAPEYDAPPEPGCFGIEGSKPSKISKPVCQSSPSMKRMIREPSTSLIQSMSQMGYVWEGTDSNHFDIRQSSVITDGCAFYKRIG